MKAILIGVAATIAMDAWNLFLGRAFGVASLDYCLLGRWFRHMPEGTFRHDAIRASARRSHECAVGWVAHYSIGIALGVGFVIVVGDGWLLRPTILPAIAFGFVTVAFPMLVMQPALGMGIASSRVPSPGRARLKSVATHVVFGLGLYLGGMLIAALAPTT